MRFRLFTALGLLFSLSCLLSAAAAEEIHSKAAVVMDAVTGRVLYAKNPDLKLLPASTTKLMTALVVLERAKLSDVTTISRKAANTPPTRVGLKEGDKVTIETLLYAALVKSANDAAVALAEAVAGSEEDFVSLMNRKAASIGASDTRYINANGLPGEGQQITAYDLAKIMRQAIKYPILKAILGTRITEVSTETGRTMVIKNTNKLLWSDEDVLGGKTGYTRQARHCFVCAGEKENETIIVALLGAPSRDLLWKETEELMAFGSKVLGKTEEPVFYLTKSDNEAAKATKAVYSRRAGTASKIGRKHKTGKAVLAKNKKRKTGGKAKPRPDTEVAAKSSETGTAIASNKTRPKKHKKTVKVAKSKGSKRNIAKRSDDDAKG